MKTLYISDLDGTLLNSEALLSERTVQILNELISGGMFFTVASARTDATALGILAQVNVNVPAVLMNGAVIYDLAGRRYVQTCSLSPKAKKHLIDTVHACGISGFLYCIDGELATYYENTSSPNAAAFIEERVRKYGKAFIHTSDFENELDKNIIYFSISDTLEKLERAREELRVCPDLHVEFYRDTYNEGCWYLEACARNASKASAVKTLREQYGFDRVVGFGDNLNDLPLFAACDESYAVANAKPEVKAAAKGTVGKNTENGVAEFLYRVRRG